MVKLLPYFSEPRDRNASEPYDTLPFISALLPPSPSSPTSSLFLCFSRSKSLIDPEFTFDIQKEIDCLFSFAVPKGTKEERWACWMTVLLTFTGQQVWSCSPMNLTETTGWKGEGKGSIHPLKITAHSMGSQFQWMYRNTIVASWSQCMYFLQCSDTGWTQTIPCGMTQNRTAFFSHYPWGLDLRAQGKHVTPRIPAVWDLREEEETEVGEE